MNRRCSRYVQISKGDIVPPIGLKDQDGTLVNLDKFRGKPLVLYFYPADETPGCTKQACAFRDSYEKFRRAGAEVVGVSGDPPESHKVYYCFTYIAFHKSILIRMVCFRSSKLWRSSAQSSEYRYRSATDQRFQSSAILTNMRFCVGF